MVHKGHQRGICVRLAGARRRRRRKICRGRGGVQSLPPARCRPYAKRKFCGRELRFQNFGGETQEKTNETLPKVRQTAHETSHREAAKLLF